MLGTLDSCFWFTFGELSFGSPPWKNSIRVPGQALVSPVSVSLANLDLCILHHLKTISVVFKTDTFRESEAPSVLWDQP